MESNDRHRRFQARIVTCTISTRSLGVLRDASASRTLRGSSIIERSNVSFRSVELRHILIRAASLLTDVVPWRSPRFAAEKSKKREREREREREKEREENAPSERDRFGKGSARARARARLLTLRVPEIYSLRYRAR
jgi:hypothetical protein